MQRKEPQVEFAGAHLPVARELSIASQLRVRIGFWKKGWKPTLDEARQAAAEIARRDNLPANEADLEDAANFYVFSRGVRDGDIALCEPLAQHAFTTMREDPTHALVHRDWVQLLLHSHRPKPADTAALAYLEYLQHADQAAAYTQSAITLWARLLQTNRASLPKAAAYLTTSFPKADLGNP